MHTETRLRPFICVDGIRHEIISPPGKVNVLMGARVGHTEYCVVAVWKDPMGSYKQFVRIDDDSDEWRLVSYLFWNHKIPPNGGIFLKIFINS